MFIQQLFEGSAKRIIVTYPGRFQPFHKGHAEVFANLQRQFGNENVFIVTSNKTDAAKSPFNFSDKVRFMHAMGIQNHNIIETDKVYDLPSRFEPIRDQVVFITVVGAPDARRLNPGATKKDGNPSYFQNVPQDKNEFQTADKHGYVIVEPEHPETITIGGKQYDVSHGTPTRELWNQIRNNPQQRAEFVTQLYGRPDGDLANTLDKIPTGAAPAPAPAAKMKNVKKDLAKVQHDPNAVAESNGYEHGFADPNAPQLGAQAKAGFKRAELQHELGHETNNLAIAINGKTWKVIPGKGYADSFEERQYLKGMQSWAAKKSASSGKKWTVHLTGAPITVDESFFGGTKSIGPWFLKKDGDVLRTVNGEPFSFKSKEEAVQWAMKTYKVSYKQQNIIPTTNPDKNLMTPNGAVVAEDITRRGVLKGLGAAAAAGAAGKASAIAGAFPSPSTREKWAKDAAASNAAEAKRQAEIKAKQDAARLKQGTADIERLNKINFHGGKVTPINATWDGDSDFMDVDGTKYAMASRMPIRGDEPGNIKLVSTKEGRQVYMWTRNSLKGVVGRYFYPAPEGSSQINEFAPDEGGGSRKFIPWTEFIEQVKQIVGKDFACKESIVKSTIKARFTPHDPMEFGPTVLYSYYETRAGGRNKGAISTRGSIQVGKYGRSRMAGATQDQLIAGFNILKGHEFERHFDLTFDNIYKIANIIMGNTQGALEFQPQQQGVAEGAPELLKAEMPLVRHIEQELTKIGYKKGTPEFNAYFNDAIKFYRQFGNFGFNKNQGVAEGSDIERKIHRTQALIQDYYNRSRNTRNDIKRDHYIDMARQLEYELEGMINDANQAEQDSYDVAQHDAEPSATWNRGGLAEAGFDAAEFRRHMADLEAREELRKTDPVTAKALDLRGQLPQASKKKSDDDSMSINDPRHPGFAYTELGHHHNVDEGDVVQFPKKHRGDITDMHTCPKCGGDTQGGKYMGHQVQVCMPCKQVYLPPNSGIDQQGNKINEYAVDAGGDGGEEDTLHKYARMWYQGDLATQQQVEQILDRMGWEIGELESEEGGCFVVRSGDENGNSYIGFAPEDLTEEKQRLDPSCWKGYRKAGTKMKGGVRVNNCVPVSESAENLNVGDPVIITGNVQFQGKTGDIDSFGEGNRFVVVNLYNHGKHSFHSSDVSYNDYADQEDDLDEDLYSYDKEDPYNSEFAPRAGMGRMTLRGWKQQMIKRTAELAQQMAAAGQDIDKSALWDNVYAKLKSMNMDPIAQEIEQAQAELARIRSQGGVRSKAFRK